MDKAAANFQDEQPQSSKAESKRYIAELERQVADLKQAYIQLEMQGDRVAEMDRLNQALAQEVIERIEAEKPLLGESRLLSSLI